VCRFQNFNIKIPDKVNVTKEILSDLHQIITITISPEDYTSGYSKQIKDLGKKVQLPGFRVGHTPMSIVQKRFGDSVLAEELNKIVNEQMGNYLKENDYNILGDALPINEERLTLDHSKQNTYTFTYEIGIQPKIELADGLSKDRTFTRYKIAAKEEEIDQEIERLRKRYGKREDVDTAENGDVIYVHLQELNPDGTENSSGVHAHSFFNYEMLTDEGLKLLSGAQKDKKYNIANLFNVFQGDKKQVARNMLMLEKAEDAEIENIHKAFEMKIERISRLYPAELDDKFFNEVMKEYGEIDTAEQLRNKIREVIENYNDRMTEVSVENDIYKHLSETLQIPLPEAFLKKWFARSQEKDITAESFDTEFAEFLSRLKQSLIFQKIQKDHGLNVKKEEVVEEAFDNVRMSYGHLGDELVN